MTTLGHRERALMALNHRDTDRVPIDLGNIHVPAHKALLEYLRMTEEVKNIESLRWRGSPRPSEALLERLGVDFRYASVGQPELASNEVLDENSYRDEWGVVWMRAPDRPHMPHIAKWGPFQEKEPSLADVERHRWPNPRDPGRVRSIRERVQKLRRETDCAVVVGLPYCILRECQRMRGFAEAMADLILNPTLTHAIMEKVLEVSAGIAVSALKEVGDIVDVVCFPEDMGSQKQLFMRPELYKKMVKPYHRRFVEAIKANTHAKVLIHSDGAIWDVIGDFIEMGIEALNPIQISANRMGDTKKMKAEFGRDLTFWGAIDTHRVLPFGTPDDVAAEVKTRIDDLSPSGGYVLASVHTINAEVPAANVAAMLETARNYRPHIS